MRIKWPKYLLIMLAGIAGLLFATTEFHSDKRASISELFGQNPWIPADDTTSYLQVQKMQDSLRELNGWKNLRIMAPGKSWSTPLGGVAHIQEDDLTKKIIPDKESLTDKYYFVLDGYFLRQDDTALQFFEKRNFYVPAESLSDNDAIRFAMIPGKADEAGKVLIPVSHSTYRWLRISLLITGILLAVFLFYIIYIRPIIVLQNISAGHAFAKVNHSYLFWAGCSLIILTAIMPILSWITFLAIKNKLPPDINYDLAISFFKYKIPLIIGIALLVLSNAFKKGYKLQQEHDMTI
ncbi:MAG TPA: DUF2975 domain-containing protein [Chitinophagaceae bacterium]|nr:DUF2975 domain-containing protein [Chitinophagaceae bacterium]